MAFEASSADEAWGDVVGIKFGIPARCRVGTPRIR